MPTSAFQLELLRALCASPLLLHPHYLAALTSLLLGRRVGESAEHAATEATTHAPRATSAPVPPWDEREAVRITPGGTAIVPMRGMLYAGVSARTAYYYGLCRPEALQAAFAQCAADSRIKAVVIDCDSPGGIVTQIPETAQELADLGKQKLTVAFASGLDCSAAYWITLQAHHLAGALTADIGNVGTYCAFYDWSAYLEKEGIRLELFKAGKFKAMGVPGTSLDDEQRAFFQADIDRTNGRFLAAVQAARPQIKRDDLEGQWWDGEMALEKGFSDSVARNLAQVIRQLEARGV
jgi:ClpP class serine protease